MAVTDQDERVHTQPQWELTEVRVRPALGEPAPQRPSEGQLGYHPRRMELLGPPLLLMAILAALVGALFLLIPWGDSTQEVDDPGAALLLTPPAASSAAAGQVPGSAEMAMLHLDVEPAGARILVDDHPVVTGPHGELEVEAGYRWLTIQREGYRLLDTLVFTSAETPTAIVVRLHQAEQGDQRLSASTPGDGNADRRPAQAREPRSTRTAEGSTQAPVLSVYVDPAGAEILLDGTSIGVAPMHIPSLDTGLYTITARKDGFETAARTVQVRRGQQRSVDLRLEPAPQRNGRLAVTVRPWGSIYVDGELQVADTDVRFTTSATPGQRRVRAVHPQLGAREVSVEVKPDELTSVVIDLEP